MRRPSPRLAEGIVTHAERTPVDPERALDQWEGYVGALREHGWEVVEAEPAGDCPDGVFRGGRRGRGARSGGADAPGGAAAARGGRVGRPIARVTALPDGAVIGFPAALDDPSVFTDLLPAPEEAGAHVAKLGDGALLMSSAAPRTAELLAARGFRPVLVEIGEFAKLEGCVTCLSIRVR